MVGSHVDTQGITLSPLDAIPPVSDAVTATVYPLGMVWGEDEFKRWGVAWGKRYRVHLRSRNQKLKDIAEKMSLAEVTLRSFTNGTRSPSLIEFMTMCQLAEVEPALILFGSRTIHDVAMEADREAKAKVDAQRQPKKVTESARKKQTKVTG